MAMITFVCLSAKLCYVIGGVFGFVYFWLMVVLVVCLCVTSLSIE